MEGNLQDLIEALHDNTTAQTEASNGILTGIKELGRNLAAYGREQILFSKKPFEILNNTGLTFSEGIKTFMEAMDSGLNKLTKAQVDQIALLKRLNVKSSLWMDQMAFNTQILKISEKGTNKLLDETMALSQNMHRNSGNLLKLQKSLSEVSKVISLQDGGPESFLRNARVIGAALGDQFYGGVQKLLGTFAGTTLESFKTSQVLGGGVLGQNAGIEEVVAMARNMVNLVDPLVKGGQGFPMYDIMSESLGFDADQLIAARAIVDNQNELLRLYYADLRATKPQLDFYATINESMRQIAQVFLPYITTGVQKLTNLLVYYQPKIVKMVERFGDFLYKNLSPQKVWGWIERLVSFLKPINNWLMENLTWENMKGAFYSLENTFHRGWQNVRGFWNDTMMPIFNGIWDSLKGIWGVVKLVGDVVQFLYQNSPPVLAYNSIKDLLRDSKNPNTSILNTDGGMGNLNYPKSLNNPKTLIYDPETKQFLQEIADNTSTSNKLLKKPQDQPKSVGGINWPPKEIRPSLFSNN